MAKEASFDVVSQVDLQEVDNALNQTEREITTRFDFKGSNTTIERKDQVIHIDTTDDMKLRNVIDMFEGKLVKRGINIKSLKYGKIVPSLGGRVKQDIDLQIGLDKEQTKKITSTIKDLKLKVQATIQGDSVRVTGKNKDDLQAAIAALKAQDFDFAVQFTNYR
ncbi:YajQ family cyclic di-GMP-binding protein [Proteiniclasticum sp. QWL-01]|uniref:YajQ family cyclic di-GMP-binding protein n=1 Tax=Proteiniclasticum sp. QWL-01 TaxID=3036945 RepID=UPI00220B1C9A|nr:YajQ family cyclic di-GMP-binding protein [Proteiniclasticum sp. QWL-01]UUM10775.1 YajQ family cyclic di-GMP-binding protein [Clostridiaceae bacterium HFYG-1003]WFF72117.1 YajQ family cyclic di-GMP-binding protein [Proteiniclasticum sp. QWL-01]